MATSLGCLHIIDKKNIECMIKNKKETFFKGLATRNIHAHTPSRVHGVDFNRLFNLCSYDHFCSPDSMKY